MFTLTLKGNPAQGLPSIHAGGRTNDVAGIVGANSGVMFGMIGSLAKVGTLYRKIQITVLYFFAFNAFRAAAKAGAFLKLTLQEARARTILSLVTFVACRRK